MNTYSILVRFKLKKGMYLSFIGKHVGNVAMWTRLAVSIDVRNSLLFKEIIRPDIIQFRLCSGKLHLFFAKSHFDTRPKR